MRRTLIAAIVAAIILAPMTATASEDTYIPEEYVGYIGRVAEAYSVCPELLEAIIEAESSGNANAANGACVGLMGVSERWHKDRMKALGVTDLKDPYSNILVGTDYLMDLADQYGDISLVLGIYNGNSKAKELYEAGKMTKYAERILKRSEELERLHGK